jgi:hypothetical protein
MTITLPETVAWSTGAAWPVDGETATIESITDQVQEIKDRSNYLKAKTTQLGLQVAAADEYDSGGVINYTVTNTTEDLPNSVFSTSLLLNDIFDCTIGPINIVNASSTTAAQLTLCVSQNSGAYAAYKGWAIPISRTMTLTVRVQIPVTASGSFSIKLQGTAGTSGATFNTIDPLNSALVYTVLRPVT